jgi:hypothetical protein
MSRRNRIPWRQRYEWVKQRTGARISASLGRLRLWFRRWGGLFVALLALILSIWTAWAEREHKRLSVRPHITPEFFYDEKMIGWRFRSEGLGPALIKVFEVYIDDRPQKSWEMFALPELGTVNHYFSNLYADEIIRAQLPFVVFAVKDSKSRAVVERAERRVRLELCYCSLYDECWRVTSFAGSRKNDSCELPRRGQTVWMGNAIRP